MGVHLFLDSQQFGDSWHKVCIKRGKIHFMHFCIASPLQDQLVHKYPRGFMVQQPICHTGPNNSFEIWPQPNFELIHDSKYRTSCVICRDGKFQDPPWVMKLADD